MQNTPDTINQRDLEKEFISILRAHPEYCDYALELIWKAMKKELERNPVEVEKNLKDAGLWETFLEATATA